MQSIIYQSIVKPASQSPDGETPDILVLTKEVNGWAAWHTGYDIGEKLLNFMTEGRAAAIEYAVDKARELRGTISVERMPNEELLRLLADAVRFIQVNAAYKGSMTAAEVEAEILQPHNQNLVRVEIGANSCSTLAAFDIGRAREMLRKYGVSE